MEWYSIVVLVGFAWADIIAGHDLAGLFFSLIDVADEKIIILIPFLMINLTYYFLFLRLLGLNLPHFYFILFHQLLPDFGWGLSLFLLPSLDEGMDKVKLSHGQLIIKFLINLAGFIEFGILIK